MPTVEANELLDLDVRRVSLVKRGANRIPFRIIKTAGGTPMLDLSRLFKADVKTPYVSAVAVRKGADLDAAKALIAAAGLSAANPEDQGTVTVFHQGDSPEAGDAVYKAGDDFGIIVANVQKGLSTWDYKSDGFNDAMQVRGFGPTLYTAMDVLGEVFCGILEKADDPAVAA